MQMEWQKENEKHTPQKKATTIQHTEMCFAAMTLLIPNGHEHISN